MVVRGQCRPQGTQPSLLRLSTAVFCSCPPQNQSQTEGYPYFFIFIVDCQIHTQVPGAVCLQIPHSCQTPVLTSASLGSQRYRIDSIPLFSRIIARGTPPLILELRLRFDVAPFREQRGSEVQPCILTCDTISARRCTICPTRPICNRNLSLEVSLNLLPSPYVRLTGACLSICGRLYLESLGNMTIISALGVLKFFDHRSFLNLTLMA